MARKASYIPLKQRKPKWYCVNKPHGKVKSLTAHRKPLYYITDSRELKMIKRMLGNPQFFDEYDYLLVSRDGLGDFEDIFGVTAPVSATGSKDFEAFEGKVDRVLFGWAQDIRHYKQMFEDDTPSGGCSTGDCGGLDVEDLE